MRFSKAVFVAVLFALVFYKGVILSMDGGSYLREKTVYKSVESIEPASGPRAPDSARKFEFREMETIAAPAAGAAPGDKEALEGIMKVVISIIFLPAGLYVILARKYDEGSKKWAFATIGTIIGAWFG